MQLFCIAETMEEERKNNVVSCKKIPLFVGKNQEREKKIPTPSRNSQGINGGVGEYYVNL